jgi:hypothetical protein
MTEDRADREGPYAEGRRPDRTYASRSFPLAGSGVPARFIYKVFDPETETEVYTEATQWLLRASSTGRVQIKLLVAREAGHVSDLVVQRVRYSVRGARAENVLHLRNQDAQRMVELLKNLEYIPVEGAEGIRLDDDMVRDLFASPESLSQLYGRDPDLFRELISNDAAARDVVAMRRRRTEVERFRTLFSDDDAFAAAVEATPSKKPEAVWQRFFEDNPWILGAGVGGA